MLADAGKAGLRTKEVEIDVRYDVDCSTKNPIHHGLEVLLMILKDIKFDNPLFYFTIPGISLGAGGLYMVVHFLQTFSMGGGLSFGFAMLMILLIAAGSFMALTGIMLHSMSTILKGVRAA
jgi:hypothetical protein